MTEFVVGKKYVSKNNSKARPWLCIGFSESGRPVLCQEDFVYSLLKGNEENFIEYQEPRKPKERWGVELDGKFFTTYPSEDAAIKMAKSYVGSCRVFLMREVIKDEVSSEYS